jgi:hypothetical protein
MFLETFNDFEGNQEFFSKFGLEIQKSARVAVARRTFEKYLPSELRNTPKEGDLIYIPMMKKLFEIKFVEEEKNFFQGGRGVARGGSIQLGKLFPYMYELSIEMFKYNGELLQTGIVEIDDIADYSAYGVKYSMAAGGIGTYDDHEIVYQGTSLAEATAKGYVSNWDITTRELTIRNAKGSWTSNVIVYGTQSGAAWTLTSGNVLEDANDPFEDNARIESEASNIIDFTEINPFGEPT